MWHTQLNVCAWNVNSWFKSWVFPFTFQAYILPHTLNFMCVSLFKFHIWILEQFWCRKKRPALPRHIKVWVSLELFGALYMYISGLGLNVMSTIPHFLEFLLSLNTSFLEIIIHRYSSRLPKRILLSNAWHVCTIENL